MHESLSTVFNLLINRMFYASYQQHYIVVEIRIVGVIFQCSFVLLPSFLRSVNINSA